MKRTALCITLATAAMAAFLSVGANAGPPLTTGSNDVPLQIEDANGKVLGRAWWVGDKWAAILQGATQVFAVPLSSVGSDSTQLHFSRQGSIYYKTTDCSGQAYLSTSNWSVRTATALHSDGRYLLLIASGVPEQPVSVNSERRRDPKVCITQSSRLTLLPVIETIDITDEYQPPFSVR